MRAAATRLVLTTVTAVAMVLATVGPAFGTDRSTPQRPETHAGLAHVVDAIGAGQLHRRGITGDGVGVALVDSGTADVPGLAGTEIVAGPDLSLESQVPALRGLDLFGHGTHMAGIIAGQDGVAPGARLVSVKVAQADGMTDVSQVIAAIDWVVAHRNDPGMNIRVLNLSFGARSLQDYQVDPLAHAVEVAWRHGIVVVVAAGNDGADAVQLTNPAIDPYVLAVGAADTKGTPSKADDVLAELSSRGTQERPVDLVAPGQGIESLRAPGSFLDEQFPAARVGDEHFRGSGTSQAAAAVSGAVALLLQERPDLTPDQVKSLLTGTARALPGADPLAAGSGMVDVKKAATRPAPDAVQSWSQSTGRGSLEAASGPSISDDWTGGLWRGGLWRGGLWRGGLWRGGLWRGGLWRGGLWRGGLWRGDVWQGGAWDASTLQG